MGDGSQMKGVKISVSLLGPAAARAPSQFGALEFTVEFTVED
jgi:hypothetical protein